MSKIICSSSNPDIRLKKAGPEDVDVFLEVERSVAGPETYSAMTGKEEALQEIAKAEVYLVFWQGQVAGNISYEMKAPGHAYLSELVTKPGFQRKGIGTTAMICILEYLKEESVQRVDLVVHPRNFRAISVYESFGFVQEGAELPNYFKDGQPRVRMVKKMKPAK